MERQDAPPTVLDYAAPPPPKCGWYSTAAAALIARIVRSTPRPLIALLLTLPAMWTYYKGIPFNVVGWAPWLFYRFTLFCALFLPGPIQRLNWRQALLALPLGVAAAGLNEAYARAHWPENTLFLRSPVTYGLDVLLVATAEAAMLHRRLDRRTFAVLVATALAAAAIVAAQFYLLQFRFPNVLLSLKYLGARQVSVEAAFVVTPLVMAAVAWLAIVLALRFLALAPPGRRTTLIFAASLATPVIAYALFFGLLIYPLADRSVEGRGPWSRLIGSGILTTRGRESDYERVWTELEHSDWTKRLNHPTEGDWRESLLTSPSPEFRTRAARRVSSILQRRPNRLLAFYALDLLLKEKRYETVPLLLRYAILPRTMNDIRLGTALCDFGVPQAAFCGINFWILNAASQLVPVPDNWLNEDRFCGPGRDEFQTLLGAPPPATRHEAFALFWQLQSTRPSPLPEPQQQEARLMNCLKRYGDAWQGETLSVTTPEPDWDAAPIDQLEQQVEARAREYERLRGPK